MAIVSIDISLETLLQFMHLQNKTTNLALCFYSIKQSSLEMLFPYDQRRSKSFLSHVSSSTMARLLLPQLLSDVTGTLYLDFDTLVVDNLVGIFNSSCWSGTKPLQMHKPVQCGVCAKKSIRKLFKSWLSASGRCALGQHIRTFTSEFNAGVMFLDLELLRKKDLLRSSLVLSRTFTLNDQAILNLFCQGNFGVLNPRLNVFVGQDHEKYSNPGIYHFAGMRKPYRSLQAPAFFKEASYNMRNIVIVWTEQYDGHADVVLQSLRSVYNACPAHRVMLFCASNTCLYKAKAHLKSIFVYRIRLDHLIQFQSPLVEWFLQHALWKVVLRGSWRTAFQRGLELSILYEKGGLLLSPGVALDCCKPLSELKPGCHHMDGTSVLLADRKSEVTMNYIAAFLAHYQKFRSNFSKVNSVDFVFSCTDQGGSPAMNIPCAKSHLDMQRRMLEIPSKQQFGVLDMSGRTKYLRMVGNKGVNLGDEIQILAGVQWLPVVDVLVDRDDLGFTKNRSIKLHSFTTVFLNAWYGTPSMTWPPHQNIDPVMVAIHVEPKVYHKFASKDSVGYLRKHTPVGARDSSTEAFLQKLGIQSFLSYCLTLTIQKTTFEGSTPCKFLLVDLDQKVHALLPLNVKERSCSLTHKWQDWSGKLSSNSARRQIRAMGILLQYSKADFVITSRLHAALPALSSGAVPLLVKSESMPGGGGQSDHFQRFAGLSSVLEMATAATLRDNISIWDKLLKSRKAKMKRVSQLRCTFLEHFFKYHPALMDNIYFFDFSIFRHCHAWKRYLSTAKKDVQSGQQH